MTNPIDIFVGKRIELRRKWLGLSLTEVAEATGLDAFAIKRFEAGTDRVGPWQLKKLCEVLEVRPTFFFSDDSNAQACGQVMTAALRAPVARARSELQ